jgi:hypothetical protein
MMPVLGRAGTRLLTLPQFSAGLRGAIAAMRRRSKLGAGDWPFVAAAGEVGPRQAWAVDDRGLRFVVVGTIVYGIDDLEILNGNIRAAARAVFDHLDAKVAA